MTDVKLISLVDAIKDRYGSVDETDYGKDAFFVGDVNRKRNKTWEMIGMEKTRLKQAQHSKLVHVVVRDCGINIAEHSEGEIGEQELVRVQELDLSGNNELTPQSLDIIVQRLPTLKVLQVSDVPTLMKADIATPLSWGKLQKLVLNNTGFVMFDQIKTMMHLDGLLELHLDSNGISCLLEGSVEDTTWSLPSVTSLSLAHNAFSSWKSSGLDKALGRIFPSLKRLFLTGNQFPNITESDVLEMNFMRHLTLLCLNDNKCLTDPNNLVHIRSLCPSMDTFRITYSFMYPSLNESLARMMVVASLPHITTLNRAAVRPKERTDSELFYVQRGLSETDEGKRHQLYPFVDELREKHKDVVLALIKEGETASSGAHVMLSLRLKCDGFEDVTKTVPSSLQVGKLKALIRTVFGVDPSHQDLGYWSGDGGLASLPTALDNELQSLAYFGVGSGSVIRVRDTSIR
jgi:tubulin-specific chaperone E